jgi:hypothetical protein
MAKKSTLYRVPSYSDSFFILGDSHSRLSSVNDDTEPLESTKHEEPIPLTPRLYLFLIKSAIHIFLISVFETIFFFKYVSVNENDGILKTIDTYYTPIVDTCPLWSAQTKQSVLYYLTDVMNYTQTVSAGSAAGIARAASNNGLMVDSLISSSVCFVVAALGAGILVWRKIPVRWVVIIGENVSMVALLGLYEYLFFRYIIYNYSTLSTPELNSYILEGIYSCVSSSYAFPK